MTKEKLMQLSKEPFTTVPTVEEAFKSVNGLTFRFIRNIHSTGILSV